jgi:hypothetical protein
LRSVDSQLQYLTAHLGVPIHLDEANLQKNRNVPSSPVTITSEIVNKWESSTWESVRINLELLSDIRKANLTFCGPIQHFNIPPVQEARDNPVGHEIRNKIGLPKANTLIIAI